MTIGGFIAPHQQQKRLAYVLELGCLKFDSMSWWKFLDKYLVLVALGSLVTKHRELILGALRNPTSDATIGNEAGGGNDDIDG